MTWLGIDEAVLAIRAGSRIILVEEADDEVRGHLMVAAEFATPVTLGWMIRHSFGIISAPAPASWLERLDLPPLPSDRPKRTGYTASVDAVVGTSTGISGADRAATLRVLSDAASKPDDLARPGHVFPVAIEELRGPLPVDAAAASLRLLALAGLAPVAGITQAMSDDASAPGPDDLATFALRHEVGMLRVEDVRRHLRLLDHRRRHPVAEPAWPHFGICEWDPDPGPARRPGVRRIS